MATNVQPPVNQDPEQPMEERSMPDRPEFMPRYPGSGRLKDKVAIVTGGDSGIGRAVSILFAREGAKVAIVYLDEHRDAEDTKRLVEAEGSQAIAIPGDVGDKSFCERAVETTVEAFGKLDVLVNNAAEQHMVTEFTELDEEQLRRTFQTNIFGYFFMTQAALRHMKEGAAIVNSTSVTSFKGNPGLIDYASTKGAITTFTRALAQNLAEKGIRVNGVAPGPIWTPLIPGSFPEEKQETFGQDTPMKRPGQPNEVAPSYLFLACEDASYMTGQILSPNGGTPVGS